MDRTRPLLLGAIGAAALALGVLVYRLDRAAGQHLFGALGDWLPSFVHVLAFSLFSAAALKPGKLARDGACAFWAAIDIAFEIGQHPAFKPRWAAALQSEAGDGPIGHAVLNYLLHGTFDPLDIAAALLGAGAAWLLLQRLDGLRETHHAACS